MIYQCYFRAEQERQLFQHEPYRGFGLEPEVNPRLLDDCPELANPVTRVSLCEYAACLHLWRHPPDDDREWIGLTSYRQLSKSGVEFESAAEVETLLQGHDLLAWNVWAIGGMRFETLTGAAAQAEWAHSGLHQFTVDMLAVQGLTLPSDYFTANHVPYANYWVLRKSWFVAFMEWSWPIVDVALRVDHPYKRVTPRSALDDKRKAVGYFVERLFIIWLLGSSLRRRWIGRIR